MMDTDFIFMTKQLVSIVEAHGGLETGLYRAIQERVLFYVALYKKARTIDKLGALKGIFELTDQILIEESDPTTSCKKGCSFCCHVPVDITTTEAALIGHYCKERHIPISKKYLKKQLRIAPSDIPLSDCSACIFLKDKECSIYPARPMNCRKHLVASEPKRCDSKTYRPPDNRVQIVSSHHLEALASAIINVGDEIDRMPLLLLPYAK